MRISFYPAVSTLLPAFCYFVKRRSGTRLLLNPQLSILSCSYARFVHCAGRFRNEAANHVFSNSVSRHTISSTFLATVFPYPFHSSWQDGKCYAALST